MEFSVVCMFTQVECAKIHCPHEQGTPVCTCRMFSSKSIPCRHVIAFLTSQGITSLPNEFICDRWKMTPHEY
ncbi:hypothetical protein ZOSMA_257G00030 [Zostera marina]|uniref:SWIM-type domain-containing protein n=1 Tax=Zostera marina TaxID=29655 RepID=A0A0K9PHW6_ZOSMR|nr:hypothetical protein ZOSMA_257G00030 [Zostera marina]